MQIKHKLKDFEMKAAQMLFYFISKALPGELRKGFFNGFPGRVDKTFVRVKIPAPDSYRDAGMTVVLKNDCSRSSD